MEQTKLTTNFFFPKEIEDEVYKDALYPKGPNPVTIKDDNELRVDLNETRHDTLVMNVAKGENGSLKASYKISIV